MRIELAERRVRLVGGPSPLCDRLHEALREQGAELEPHRPGMDMEEGPLDLLVCISNSEMGAQKLAARIQALVPRLARRGGRIVNVVSASGLVPMRGAGRMSALAAGVIALTRVLAMDLAEQGIMVNALAVGPLAESDYVSAKYAARGASQVSHTALGRPVTLDEVAAGLLFLADPTNSYMTGQVLTVDAGWTAGYVRDF